MNTIGLTQVGGILVRSVRLPAHHPWTPLPDHPAFAPLARAATVVALDLETTGLSATGCVAFLIGLAVPVSESEVLVHQLLLPDYPAEDELLTKLEGLLASFAPPVAIVTFNGDRFDLPFLSARAILHRRRLRFPDRLDVLSIARRLYKPLAGSCRLTHLEEIRLDIHRQDDLPGALVPAVYFDYLRHQRLATLEPVLRHNALDVASTLALLQAAASDLTAPPSSDHLPAEVWLGRAAVDEWLGDRPAVEGSLRRALALATTKTVRLSAEDRLVNVYKRAGDWQAAEILLSDLCGGGFAELRHLIAWAKILEHGRKDFLKAWEVTSRALAQTEAKARLGMAAPPLASQSLKHRLARLELKLRRAARPTG